MNQTFKQTVTFKLDKAHLQECFEQSAPPVQTKDYRKAVIFAVISFALIFVEAEHYYFVYFFLGLALIEVFSLRYRQTWWVWRQLMSKAANGLVTLIVDEDGISSQSEQLNTHLLWKDVTAIETTAKGLLLKHQKGVNYLSNSHLGEQLAEYILSKKPNQAKV